MKKVVFVAALLVTLALTATAQSKSSEAIRQQIRNAHADKSLALSSDPGGNTSKLMGVSENFADGEASSAGIRAMNFAVGFFYAGQDLAKSPDQVMLTFWVLTKKPRFAENHHLAVVLPNETLDLGDARYAAKPRSDMEYLNFEISRENLKKIVKSNARIHLGDHDFTLTREQMKLLGDVLLVSDIKQTS